MFCSVHLWDFFGARHAKKETTKRPNDDGIAEYAGNTVIGLQAFCREHKGETIRVLKLALNAKPATVAVDKIKFYHQGHTCMLPALEGTVIARDQCEECPHHSLNHSK